MNKTCAILLACCLAGHAASQNARVGQRQSEWPGLVARLADPTRRDFAIAELDKLGPDAVRRLIAMVDVAKPDLAQPLLYAASELAHHAAGEWQNIARLRATTAELTVSILELRAAVIPFLTAADTIGATRAGALEAMAQMRADHPMELRREFGRVYSWFTQLVPVGNDAVGIDVSVERLIGQLRRPNGHLIPYRGEAVARLLAHAVPSAIAAKAGLLEQLQRPVLGREESLRLNGEIVRYQTGPSTHRWAAVALTRVVPGTDEALRAHGYLARWGNPFEFAGAIQTIREQPEEAANAVPHLIAVLHGSDARPGTRSERGEVITTLGIMGALAKPAIPVLSEIASGEERALAVPARAALRQIQ